MNDFDYDCLQRKRIASGARHMKNGSKSRRCSLPSDRLTEAQLKRKNGEIMTYKLDEPCTLKEFQSFPEDIQREYIQSMRDLYQVTNRMLGQMWGVSETRAQQIVKALGLTTGKLGAMPQKDRAIRDEKWKAFLNGGMGGGNDIKPAEDDTVDGPDDTDEVVRYTARAPLPDSTIPVIRHEEICFTGDFTTETLGEYIKTLTLPEGEITVRLVIDK